MNPRFRLFASSSFQPDCAKRMFAEQALMPKGLGNTGIWYLAADGQVCAVALTFRILQA